jgi:hypothetical protein
MDYDYEKYQDEQLESGGFDLSKLSAYQKSVILQPSEAPENYYCDGEITPQQAFNAWNFRLRQCGLTLEQQTRAINFNR